MTVHRIVLVTAAACLLLASSHTSAQAPPAAPDADQRLKALEDKMDRVLKLVEARTAPQTAKATPAIEAVRDQVKAKLQAKERVYTDLRRKNPSSTGEQGGITLVAGRIGRLESRRSELTIRMAELADLVARKEKAYKKIKDYKEKPEGNRITHHLIRSGPGSGWDNPSHLEETLLDLKLARTLVISGGAPRNHPRIKEIDEQIAKLETALGVPPNFSAGIEVLTQLSLERRARLVANGELDTQVEKLDEAIALIQRTYLINATDKEDDAKATIDALKEETAEASTRVESLTKLIETETKAARELNAIQKKEDSLRGEIEGLRNTLKVLDSLLADDAPQKPR